MTEKRVREQLAYYGFKGEDLEAATQAYMERVDDGDAPDLAEWADAWKEMMT
jgi:hypothetical protein